MTFSSSTGEMIVSDVTCTGDMKTNTATGDVNKEIVTCRNLFSAGSTGDIILKSVIAAGKISVERSTGMLYLTARILRRSSKNKHGRHLRPEDCSRQKM